MNRSDRVGMAITLLMWAVAGLSAVGLLALLAIVAGDAAGQTLPPCDGPGRVVDPPSWDGTVLEVPVEGFEGCDLDDDDLDDALSYALDCDGSICPPPFQYSSTCEEDWVHHICRPPRCYPPLLGSIDHIFLRPRAQGWAWWVHVRHASDACYLGHLGRIYEVRLPIPERITTRLVEAEVLFSSGFETGSTAEWSRAVP